MSQTPLIEHLGRLRGYLRLNECEQLAVRGDLPVLDDHGAVIGSVKLGPESTGEDLTKLGIAPLERDVRAGLFLDLVETETALLVRCLGAGHVEHIRAAAGACVAADELPYLPESFSMAAVQEWLDALNRYERALLARRVAAELAQHETVGDATLTELRRQLVELREAIFRSNIGLVLWTVRENGRGASDPNLAIIAGSDGLNEAIDRFDPSRGTQFSTYASWWIRHMAMRARADHGSTLRVPVHSLERLLRYARAERALWRQLGHRPSMGEILRAADLEAVRVDDFEQLQRSAVDADLGATLDEEGLAERIVDPDVPSPLGGGLLDGHVTALKSLLEEQMDRIEASLPRADAETRRRYREILMLRLGDNPMTLLAIGQRYDVSRERIRQIQEQCLGIISHHLRFAQAELFVLLSEMDN